jgi:hypothetical protein
MLGELPPPDVRQLLRFYSITGKLEATHLGLAAMAARRDCASSDTERESLTASITRERETLGALLDDAWDVGTDARESLDELVRAGWMDAPPVLADASTIRERARARHTVREAK